MEIIVTIKSIISFIFLILVIIYKNIIKMIKLIKWFKSLFTKKQTNEATKIETSAIKDPSGKPTKGPR
jgi:hypothetical protein